MPESKSSAVNLLTKQLAALSSQVNSMSAVAAGTLSPPEAEPRIVYSKPEEFIFNPYDASIGVPAEGEKLSRTSTSTARKNLNVPRAANLSDLRVQTTLYRCSRPL